MCGIVGYVGTSNGTIPVLEGLARLEYRGYDSSGISLINDEKISIYKKEGKLQNLKDSIKDMGLKSTLCIGHTRWATHGEVNDTNAHPHGNEEFAIVHNGIIENANELRKDLISKSYEFQSQTDSEVFLVLLTHNFKELQNVEEAIRKTFSTVAGNSAFVVLNNKTQKLYAIKRSAPLVCGLNEKTKEAFMSSDPYALVGFTTKIYFPEDEILCIADANNIQNLVSFKDINGKESKAYKVQKKQVEAQVISKSGYDHFMLKEIHEQPELIKKLESIYLSSEGLQQLESLSRYNNSSYIHLSACGTALHAGLVIKNYIEKLSTIKVGCDFASEFRYRQPNLSEKDLGLFISQSGETADTLACQEMCKENKLKTLSIVNVEGSTLFRNCDENLLIHAGQEIGVASTKAFTQQVLVGLLMARSIATKLDKKLITDELKVLVAQIKDVLSREAEIKMIAKEIYTKNGFIFTGRGEQFPIALEGALKLKEIAYVHAEGYAAGELKHGPISLIDENMVNVAIVTPDLFEKTFSNAQEVKARRGVMVIVGESGNKDLQEISDHFFGVNFEGLDDTKPVLTNIVLQLLSYHIAKLKGTDIDKPRNLAKSVTVE